jgi:protein required for attachment to host cells
MSDRTQTSIAAELAKDLVKLPVSEIEAHLSDFGDT